jgi:hypothetical protein
MKANYLQLKKLMDSRFFDIEHFYTITLNSSGITLQGKYNASTIKYYEKKKFFFAVGDNGFIEAKRGRFEIVLT